MSQVWKSYFTVIFTFTLPLLAPANKVEAGRYYRSNGGYGRGGHYSGYGNWHRNYYSGYYTWPRYYAYYGGPAYYAYPYYSTYYYSYPSYYTDYIYPSYPYKGYYYQNDSIMSSNPPNSLETGVFYNNN